MTEIVVSGQLMRYKWFMLQFPFNLVHCYYLCYNNNKHILGHGCLGSLVCRIVYRIIQMSAKASDKVNIVKLWNILGTYGIPPHLIRTFEVCVQITILKYILVGYLSGSETRLFSFTSII